MSGPGSSFPPPPASNPVTQTWYQAQRNAERVKELQAELDDFKAQALREIGELKGEVRHLKLQARRSGHDLEKLQEWQETSEIRDLREQLAEANRRLTEGRRSGGKWDGRMWALVSAVILTLATAIAAALTGGHGPHAEPPPGIPLHSSPAP